MDCCVKYSRKCVVTIDEEYIQGSSEAGKAEHDDLKIKGTSKKGIHSQINQILLLLDEITGQANNYEEHIKQICNILESNKRLLNYQHCKDNKLRSLLHIIKYNANLPYEVKHELVNAIVDIGHKSFAFSEHNCVEDNFDAYFFTAAVGEYTKLIEIINYFKTIDCEGKLHDTREGDTVLSFMVKFGDYKQENFFDCFDYLVKQSIDVERIDYYNKNISEIINNQINFLQKRMKNNISETQQKTEVAGLTKIADIIDRSRNIEKQQGKYRSKYKLFCNLIKRDERFGKYLQENRSLKDSDDGENTLLQLAIIKNNLEITKQLLQKGANPNSTVAGRNVEVPLMLAAKLNREEIFLEILKNENLQIDNEIFIKFIKDIKPKFFNYLLESKNLNIEYEYNGKTPLYYAIRRNNKTAIQSLLQRGAKLDENCLTNISPKDLEDYLNSCIKFDSFKEDMEENDYKAFIVFDFFIQPSIGLIENENDAMENLIPCVKLESEIENLRNIGSNKRLKHLLEHPLIHIFIRLKWYCVRIYYYWFVILKFLFYAIIALLVYTRALNILLLIPVLMTQFIIVYFNCLEFKLEIKRYTLHFILEILIFVLLLIIVTLSWIPGALNWINQVSAFVIIFTSLSFLLTLGYHKSLSKWTSMAKRVFKNFGILLLFFLFPILAFAMAFTLLLPFKKDDSQTDIENGDFRNIPSAIFRTFVLLSGDIGDKQFDSLASYILFLLFSIGMAIILLNFWTGVAVSDIKEIEEQSFVVAFNNVIVFIDGVERIYVFIICKLLPKLPPRLKRFVSIKIPLPFLEPRIKLDKKKKSKYHYGIDLYINNERQFKDNKNFNSLKLETAVKSTIKSLYDEKEISVVKTLKHLKDQIEDMYKEIRTYKNYFQKIEELLESRYEDKKEKKKKNVEKGG